MALRLRHRFSASKTADDMIPGERAAHSLLVPTLEIWLQIWPETFRENLKNASNLNTRAQSDARGVALSAPAAMAAERGVETRARKRKRVLEAAQLAIAIPNLPFDVVVSHVFREMHLPDPADLAVLRGVSRGMRAAVDASGRKIKGLGERCAAERGYLSTLKCLRRRGVLKNERLLCAAAARKGDFEALKALRAENFPWDALTCSYAARGGHLEVLKWARENGCPWNEYTCRAAAGGGHLEVLEWMGANGFTFERTWTRVEEGYENMMRQGNLEVFKFARANGFCWDEDLCPQAARWGQMEILQWARANGCP